MTLPLYFKILIFSSLFISCSFFEVFESFDEEDCKKVSWIKLGNDQAQQGFPYERLAHFQQICSEYKVSINEEEFKTGYQSGLKKYCTYHRGYEAGQKDQKYLGICPKDSEYEFLRGLQKAKRDKEK